MSVCSSKACLHLWQLLRVRRILWMVLIIMATVNPFTTHASPMDHASTSSVCFFFITGRYWSMYNSIIVWGGKFRNSNEQQRTKCYRPERKCWAIPISLLLKVDMTDPNYSEGQWSWSVSSPVSTHSKKTPREECSKMDFKPKNIFTRDLMKSFSSFS